ncbi:aminopeptidase sgcX [Salmonella enterica subsp. enterica]|nr:aminopeptidase sgcX [Salmonella enterica subsp. enterica]
MKWVLWYARSNPPVFLRFERVGGPAQITMPGSIVTLAGRSGDIMGCIGIKAYHFAKGDERTQPPALDKLWIDIGAKDKADAERMGIQVGTPVTLYNPPHCLGNDLVCSKALDDRLGCTALLGVAEALASTPLDIAVFLVASVQEEFNIRGIIPVLRRVRPDLAIGIDITPSCDTPDLQDYSRCAGQPRRRHHLSELSRTRYVGGTDYAAAFAADAGDHRARK